MCRFRGPVPTPNIKPDFSGLTAGNVTSRRQRAANFALNAWEKLLRWIS